MDRTERLFNLVLALTSTARPIPRETLRSIIDGYADSTSDASFERMFERDKDELRSLGIPVETVTTGEGEVLGYVVPRDDYRLPPIRFTSAQWSLLGVAARAWSQAASADPARSAVRKLEAAGAVDGTATGGAAEVVAWQVRPEGGEQWLPALWGAIRRRSRVGFDYLGLRDQVSSSRLVDPWSVVGRRGGWYLIGFDVDRQAPRAFRLSRITGIVTSSGHIAEFDIPEHDVDAILGGAELDQQVSDAWIAVAVGGGERLRLFSAEAAPGDEPDLADIPEGFDLVHVVSRDVASLVADVAALGERAKVVHPPSIARMVREHLNRVAKAHREDSQRRVSSP